MTWATDRLDALVARKAEPPPVVNTMKMGLVDEWSEGRAFKRWEPSVEILNGDGSMFGGYIAALADQMLAFAAMTAVPVTAHSAPSISTCNSSRLDVPTRS